MNNNNDRKKYAMKNVYERLKELWRAINFQALLFNYDYHAGSRDNVLIQILTLFYRGN